MPTTTSPTARARTSARATGSGARRPVERRARTRGIGSTTFGAPATTSSAAAARYGAARICHMAGTLHRRSDTAGRLRGRRPTDVVAPRGHEAGRCPGAGKRRTTSVERGEGRPEGSQPLTAAIESGEDPQPLVRHGHGVLEVGGP